MPPSPARLRDRRDRCPGVLRPWPADDGDLVRVRLVGGELSSAALTGLAGLAAAYGDGELHLTARANLQLRAVAHGEAFVAAVEDLGLLPSRAHDQARNVLVSPLTGRVGGRADLRPVAADLDARLLAEPRLAHLPGRFLLVLDDGRGDVVDRDADLGLVVLDERSVQLRVGDGWGPVVPLDDAVGALLDLALLFLEVRGDGPDAAWHVSELAAPLVEAHAPDPRADVRSEPPAPGGAHLAVPDGVLTPALVALATATGGPLVVTPWRSIVRTDLLP